MRDNHIMVDLETLDTKPTAAILSIGACRVNWDTGEPTDPFYRIIEVDSCKEVGLTESESTKKWWSTQSAEARRVFTDPSVSLLQALSEFSKYLGQFNKNTVKIWGCGSDFDNVILGNAYQALGSPAPWRFYNNRCYRTVRELFKDRIEDHPREGTYHNALDDAMHQSRVLLQLKGLIS